MRGWATFAIIAVVGALTTGAASGEVSSAELDATPAAAGIDVSSQTRSERNRKRPRLQLRVYPRYPYRTFHTPYPLPYRIEYPGPNGVRHCTSNLVLEHRL